MSNGLLALAHTTFWLLFAPLMAASLAVKAWERSHRPVPADTHRR